MLTSAISFKDLDFSSQQEIFNQVKTVIREDLTEEALAENTSIIELYGLNDEDQLDSMIEEMTIDRINKNWHCEATY